MKKIISISLLSVLLLSSCSIDWNDEKAKTITTQDTKISKLEKQIEDYKKEKEDDLFKKNQECNKNKEKFINEQLTLNKNFRLVEIFYSPILKTCIAGSKLDYNYNGEFVISYFIDDILTGKEFINNKNGLYGWESLDYENKIRELKGE